MKLTAPKANLIGSAIQGLSSLFGGSKAASEARKLRRMQQRQFDESMDHTVLRRVRDAQRAGIHPLAALGMSPGAGPTLTGAGLGAEGEAISRAGEAVGRGVANHPLVKAQMAETKSRIQLNEANAALARSEAARLSPRNPGTSGGENDNGVRTFPLQGWDPGTLPKGDYIRMDTPPPNAKRDMQAGDVYMDAWQTHSDGHRYRNFGPGTEMDEAKQVIMVRERAKWHKAWDTIKKYGERTPAGQKALGYILSHVDPRQKQKVIDRLNKYRKPRHPRPKPLFKTYWEALRR